MVWMWVKKIAALNDYSSETSDKHCFIVRDSSPNVWTGNHLQCRLQLEFYSCKGENMRAFQYSTKTSLLSHYTRKHQQKYRWSVQQSGGGLRSRKKYSTWLYTLYTVLPSACMRQVPWKIEGFFSITWRTVQHVFVKIVECLHSPRASMYIFVWLFCPGFSWQPSCYCLL